MSSNFYGGPCGTEPYNKDFGLGNSSMVENPSPYDRIHKILSRYEKTTNGVLNSARLNIITDTYKRLESAPQSIKCAEALADVLRQAPIRIYPYELVVGELACPAKEAGVFPEFSMNWLIDEINNNTLGFCPQRTHDYFDCPEDVKRDVLGHADYWKGKSIEDHVLARLSDDDKKGFAEKSVFLLNAYIRGGVGHTSPDFDLLLTNGFTWLKDRILRLQAKLNLSLPEDIKKDVFYRGELIVLDATVDHIRRYAALAWQMALEEPDLERKYELELIAKNCEWISVNPPRDFWEAVQLYHFSINIAQIESNGHAICYGRFDQIMYPFYKQSLEMGTQDKHQIQQIIECLYIKIFELNKVRDKESIGIFANGGIGGPCMTVGGVNEQGMDATNDLTFMCLDGHAHTRIPCPWIAVRMHGATPWELKVKVASCIKMGTGEPKVFNDECTIPMMASYGRSIQDSRNYQVVGCVEPDVAGKENGWHDAAYFSMAKVFELAINDGRCIDCGSSCTRFSRCAGIGSQLGIRTGSLSCFKNFDEVLAAYDRQMEYWTDKLVYTLNVIDQVHQEIKPLPFLSLLQEDCTENGLDVTAGGARYNFTGPQGVGVGTVGDGFATIKQLVFEEKRVTGAELLQAARENWVGHEPLYALVNSDKVHHYGNDDDYADALAKYAMDTYCKHVEKRPNARGGVFSPGVYSVSINVGFGLTQWASIEGRTAYEPISDCMGAVHTHGGSHDVKGPTAIAKSVTKLDHMRAGNGTLLNWKFSPSCLAGDSGVSNLISLIDTFMSRKGMHSQFSIVDQSTLIEAQKHPDEYRGLMVRVAGYSAFFVELSRELQEDIIGRTSLSFD